MKGLLLLMAAVLIGTASVQAWGNSGKDKVLLEKVTAITLEEGKRTNARRSSSIPQLECVGGSAGCYGYRPKVVQCLNAGFDGSDVQWECRAEMDSKYRFGRIDVSCEGYDYPDDPYVLKGSCGLRYELDLTEEGHRAKRGSSYHDSGHHQHQYHRESTGSGNTWIGTLIQLAILGAIVYCCLGICMRGAGESSHRTYTDTSGAADYSYSSYGGRNRGSSGPGFWTGAATGGALGYLFGNRGRTYGGGGYGSGWGTSGGGWGSSGGGWGSSGGGSSSRSSSSRTTSGYGGTSRR